LCNENLRLEWSWSSPRVMYKLSSLWLVSSPSSYSTYPYLWDMTCSSFSAAAIATSSKYVEGTKSPCQHKVFSRIDMIKLWASIASFPLWECLPALHKSTNIHTKCRRAAVNVYSMFLFLIMFLFFLRNSIKLYSPLTLWHDVTRCLEGERTLFHLSATKFFKKVMFLREDERGTKNRVN